MDGRDHTRVSEDQRTEREVVQLVRERPPKRTGTAAVGKGMLPEQLHMSKEVKILRHGLPQGSPKAVNHQR